MGQREWKSRRERIPDFEPREERPEPPAGSPKSAPPRSVPPRHRGGAAAGSRDRDPLPEQGSAGIPGAGTRSRSREVPGYREPGPGPAPGAGKCQDNGSRDRDPLPEQGSAGISPSLGKRLGNAGNRFPARFVARLSGFWGSLSPEPREERPEPPAGSPKSAPPRSVPPRHRGGAAAGSRDRDPLPEPGGAGIPGAGTRSRSREVPGYREPGPGPAPGAGKCRDTGSRDRDPLLEQGSARITGAGTGTRSRSREVPGYREPGPGPALGAGKCRDTGSIPGTAARCPRRSLPVPALEVFNPKADFGAWDIRVFNELERNFCPRANSSSGAEFPGNRAGRTPLPQKPRGQNRERDTIPPPLELNPPRREARLPKEEEMRELTGTPGKERPERPRARPRNAAVRGIQPRIPDPAADVASRPVLPGRQRLRYRHSPSPSSAAPPGSNRIRTPLYRQELPRYRQGSTVSVPPGTGTIRSAPGRIPPGGDPRYRHHPIPAGSSRGETRRYRQQPLRIRHLPVPPRCRLSPPYRVGTCGERPVRPGAGECGGGAGAARARGRSGAAPGPVPPPALPRARPL
ncbi:basic proline-rich protein-like [Pyrgilauda ruficollis]|uniref:basic proline-rich protein-like n=1 Tax=Pyrgilauda ruficollis TaxID=221976 RepID=UPI001B87414E|nr:basic proline-rich protein-like [Pyrgilauda ruficollis]